MFSYNLFTECPQKLWKTEKRSFILRICCILFCLCLVTSCASSKKKEEAPKTDAKTIENALIDMNEQEVRKRFGEPEVVSKTPQNNIIWTYRPSWKIMPTNTNTLYIEFDQNGKVVKVIKKK